jgi:transposase-like protein
MDFTQEQVSEILEKIASGKDGYQQLLKKCLEAIMKAERHEFNLVNNDLSNGFRLSSTYSQDSKMELVVPRTRNHNFYPMILALVKEQDKEINSLAYELYSSGLTTIQIGGIFDKLYGHHYSKASISTMMQTAREDVFGWLERDLDKRYPIIYIDATYWHTRRIDSVSCEAYYTILGVKEDKSREVLAIVNHPTEGSSNWGAIFNRLKERGVKEVNLVVCDGLIGIEQRIADAFPMAEVQLCTVHLTRNLISKVKPSDKSEVLGDIQKVLNPDEQNETQLNAWNKFEEMIHKWKKKYPSLSSYLNNRNRLYFTYFNYHYQIRRMIYTTNWIERLNRDYKRVLRMRSSMPNPESVVFLLGSVAMRKKQYLHPIYQFQYESKLF